MRYHTDVKIECRATGSDALAVISGLYIVYVCLGLFRFGQALRA